MQKLDMLTPDMLRENIEAIARLFPNIITEREDADGNIVKAIDYDLFRQMYSDSLVEWAEERYRLDWPGKRASILKANTPIDKTLRPVVEDSVNWDTTENLYIEWDNFEILKVLQESYLGKVKMIYIDPPYNTGTAMIYPNDYSLSEEEFDESIWATDSDWVKLFKNTDTNWRFHSDWLSMMYERIIVSRDLLKEDWFMALAIDHNELHTLTSICDEIFWEENRLWVITVVHKPEWRNQEKFFWTSNEFMIVYSKNKDYANFNDVVLDDELAENFSMEDEKGKYKLKNFIRMSDWKYSLRENKPGFWYPVYVSNDLKSMTLEEKDWYFQVYPITDAWQERTWKTTPETLMDRYDEWELIAINEGWKVFLYEKLREKQVIKTHWIDKKYHWYHFGTKIIDSLLWDKTFDFPKSLFLMKDVLKVMLRKDDIVLDFFSWSWTTAHAVMQLNAEDEGNRKFIMVQIPEETDKDSNARKAGYKNICEIGKERIRRAGKKIIEENKDKEGIENLDIGFRVYRLDTSNMKDVYYHPTEVTQDSLFDMESNIKPDRTPEDILAQVMLDLGLTLDLSIEKRVIHGSTVFYVAGNSLVACFDEHVDFALVDSIAQDKPLRVVLRDSSFSSDADRINFETRFAKLSPETDIRVI